MPDEMTAQDFTRALQALGLAEQRGALEDAVIGAAMASDARTVRRWRQGERAIPGPAAKLVRLWLAIKTSRRIPDSAKQALLPRPR